VRGGRGAGLRAHILDAVGDRRLRGPSLLHFHGWLFTAWMAVFVLQARAAATSRFDRHRAVGLAGIAVATAMFFTGLMVAVHAIERGTAAGFGPEVRAFAIVPISIILFVPQ
jgi:hypothetical protein